MDHRFEFVQHSSRTIDNVSFTHFAFDKLVLFPIEVDEIFSEVVNEV